jgi:nitroreductase
MYVQKEAKAVPDVVNAPYCIQCGHCLMRCPTDAISVPGLSPDQIHDLGRLPDVDEMANLLRGRRSLRVFSGQKVDRVTLEKVISLAATAPSAHNTQTTEFVVIQNPETIRLAEQYTTEAMERISNVLHNAFRRSVARIRLGKQFNAAVKALPVFDRAIEGQRAGGHRILHEAPALIAFHGQTGSMADINAQLCMENAMLAMYGMGLAGYYCGFVTLMAPRDKRLLELLKIPPDHELYGVLAVGYSKIELTRWVERKPRITWD